MGLKLHVVVRQKSPEYLGKSSYIKEERNSQGRVPLLPNVVEVGVAVVTGTAGDERVALAWGFVVGF